MGRCGQWTENPRVGGSIPPLATTKFNNFNQEVTSERIDSLSNIGARVQYFGPLCVLTSIKLV
jgi:hypothetical protein